MISKWFILVDVYFGRASSSLVSLWLPVRVKKKNIKIHWQHHTTQDVYIYFFKGNKKPFLSQIASLYFIIRAVCLFLDFSLKSIQRVRYLRLFLKCIFYYVMLVLKTDTSPRLCDFLCVDLLSGARRTFAQSPLHLEAEILKEKKG